MTLLQTGVAPSVTALFVVGIVACGIATLPMDVVLADERLSTDPVRAVLAERGVTARYTVGHKFVNTPVKLSSSTDFLAPERATRSFN